MVKKFSSIKGGDNGGQVEHNLPLIHISLEVKTTMPRGIYLEAVKYLLEEHLKQININSTKSTLIRVFLRTIREIGRLQS